MPNKSITNVTRSGSVNLRAAYVCQYNELCAVFEGDPTITVGPLVHSTRTCFVETQDIEKFNILNKFLIKDYEAAKKSVLGLKVQVRCPNAGASSDMTEKDLATLMKDNPSFSRHIHVGEEGSFMQFDSIVFKRKVKSYDIDNLFNPWGCTDKLMPDMIKDVFNSHCNMAIEPEV